MGVDVFKMRDLAVVVGGAFAGAAGAHLSLGVIQLWSPGMAAGRGWIAVALVIFAQWRPERILVGAYLFGMFDALQLYSQGLDLTLSSSTPLAGTLNPILNFVFDPQIMATYPYLATLIVLFLTVARSENSHLAEPSGLVQPYSRETD
jgi:simple sugar transport system permease protein